ncbi:thymidylate synthase [uncultured Methanobrevibacter sp.]|uniref:thymidylate synthase n=1 Tax=uncultured Methanobrevibacter sp. TaxID=253161 RepID=UPI00258EAD75|nr:thymidylate synthase [uncultured Methanobrevibacter sp.]
MLSINQCYLDFVDKILKSGKETYKDSNHHLLESLGNFYIIDDPMDLKFRAKYQNYTTEMMLDDIKSGKYDLEGCPIKSDALYQYVQSVEDPEIINNTQGFVYTYPNRIFAHFDVDQFESMKKRILTATGSNRAVAVTINPIEDAEEEDMFLQCLVRDNELTIHCIFRSNDIFGAFYSNMFFIAYLGLKMKEEVNKEIVGEKLNFGGVHYHSTSGHIYNTDIKAARQLIKANK